MKPKILSTDLLREIIASMLILLFVYTAASKLWEFGRFREILETSPVIARFTGFVSVAVPAAELGTALLLFLPATRHAGMICSSALMAIFTLYISYMILFTPHLPCSCGGVIRHMSWKQHLVFNIFFAALAIEGVWLGSNNKNMQIQSHHPKSLLQ